GVQLATLNVEGIVRRLFSTFATGLPGLGLLLVRLVAGGTLIGFALARFLTGKSAEPLASAVITLIAGILLFACLLTPITGTIVAVIGLRGAILHIGDPVADILLATMGGALALIGPGAWSVDARIFGWKQIDVREGRK